MTITHVFLDIGGVLGTNGWDTNSRLKAVETFGLDEADYAERHKEAVGTWESGRMSLDEYLTCTVFYRPRPFPREAFVEFMKKESRAFPDTVALARRLAQAGRWRLATINNESAELNDYRLQLFGLRDIFAAFYSSCWLGHLKPARRIYELALAISQANPKTSVFVDDRERNLDPARALGMTGVLYTGADQLRADLAALGVAL